MSAPRACLAALLLGALAPPALADCAPAVRAIAELRVSEVPADADPAARADALERVLEVCERQDWWLALGDARAAQGRHADARAAYTAARDLHAPDADGLLPPEQLRGQVDADVGLARAFEAEGDPAGALAAIEDARRGLALLGQTPDAALTELQARVDDAMSAADAGTLTRSLRSQRTARTRAIGVRPRAGDAGTTASAPLPSAAPSSAPSGREGTDGTAPSAASATAPPPTAPSVARINLQVLFGFDSDRISAESDALVDAMADAVASLELEPGQRVWVIGHTDVRGPADYNAALAARRAEAVRDRLAARFGAGVPLVALGRGESAPRYPGTRAEDHRRNRRVELVVARDEPSVP